MTNVLSLRSGVSTLESTNSEQESVDCSADFYMDPMRIGMWVRALKKNVKKVNREAKCREDVDLISNNNTFYCKPKLPVISDNLEYSLEIRC